MKSFSALLFLSSLVASASAQTCEDNPNFKFIVHNNNDEKISVGCSWITENESKVAIRRAAKCDPNNKFESTDKYGTTSYFNGAKNCPLSCGLCTRTGTDTNTCGTNPNFKFLAFVYQLNKQDYVGCDWLKETGITQDQINNRYNNHCLQNPNVLKNCCECVNRNDGPDGTGGAPKTPKMTKDPKGTKSPSSILTKSPSSKGTKSPSSKGTKSPSSKGTKSPSSKGTKSPSSKGTKSPTPKAPKSPSGGGGAARANGACGNPNNASVTPKATIGFFASPDATLESLNEQFCASATPARRFLQTTTGKLDGIDFLSLTKTAEENNDVCTSANNNKMCRYRAEIIAYYTGFTALSGDELIKALAESVKVELIPETKGVAQDIKVLSSATATDGSSTTTTNPASIAVPVVLIALVFVGAAFFMVRRRNNNRPSDSSIASSYAQGNVRDEDGSIVFPVSSNVHGDEYEVSSRM